MACAPPATIADTPPPAQAKRRPWRALAWTLLLLLMPLAGVTAFLVVFQPLADAVGGCGGG